MEKGSSATVTKQAKGAAAATAVRVPLEQQTFEEHQLAILSHPLLPYVLRAINDVNGELTDYIPPSSTWQDSGADPEVTDFLLQYLKLVEAQNAAANRLQAQAVLYCSRAAEERIQSAKADSISEADSDIDSPVENASAQGGQSGQKRTRSQSSFEDTNTRNQRLRVGSVDGSIEHPEKAPVAVPNNMTSNNISPSPMPVMNAAPVAAPAVQQQKQISPRMAAKVESSEEQQQRHHSMSSQTTAMPAMAQAVSGVPTPQKADQSVMHQAHQQQQWIRAGVQQSSNQGISQPQGGYPAAQIQQPNPSMGYYPPPPQGSNYYGRPAQPYVPMPNDPQMMRQRQLGYPGQGLVYSDQLPRSPNSGGSAQVPTGSYMAQGFSYGQPPPDMMRYGYMNPSQPNANMPMQRSMPLMNQLPGNPLTSSGQDSVQGQNQVAQAQMQQARMQHMQHAAMQAQMQQMQMAQGQMGSAQPGVQMAQVQLPQSQQMQHRNPSQPPTRPPNY
eukprot:TRINITY_DN5056_c0_g1_i1.p1 TRINITY_DN5056_c0_g1~~TRINITY_DN5056_c0_g1_i1.p1  ORF type:complete len:510 (-),score=106.36 TRINITY_DN5056_c0_g1_i1:38-1534(-)